MSVAIADNGKCCMYHYTERNKTDPVTERGHLYRVMDKGQVSLFMVVWMKNKMVKKRFKKTVRHGVFWFFYSG